MTITNEQIEQIADEMIAEAFKDEETREEFRLLAACTVAGSEFSFEGFEAFFEVMHGSKMHGEGRKWARGVFDAIDTGFRKALIEAFRGSGKTTELSKLFFAYFLGHHPHTTNGVVRVNTQKANETITDVAALIQNDPNWKRIFPHVVPSDLKNEKWGEKGGYFLMRTDITTAEWQQLRRKTHRPTGPTFIGYGYDSGSIQGFRVNGILFIDDIHDKENTRSDRQLEDVKEFVKYQLLPIPVPDIGLEIWCFTPWLTNDAYAVRKSTGLYVHVHSPIMEESEDGEMWPESFGIEAIDRVAFPFAKKKWKLNWGERWGFRQIATKYIDIGHMAFSREFLLDLEATKGQLLKQEWLHYYEGPGQASWPVYMGADYASVADKLKHKDRDYFALSVFRAIPGGGLVLFDGYRGHVTKGEALQTVANYSALYPQTKLIGVEAIGKGEEFYNDLVLTNDIYGKPLKLRKITHGRVSKGDRFENWLAPRFMSARIWISDTPTPFLTEFENEWLSYPNGEHDDCLDAAYMGAFAGEGALPSKAQRTEREERSGEFIFQSLTR